MTEPYTASDVRLVATAIGAEYWLPTDRADAARAILAALAEAGRLVPDGAEVEIREEWGIVWHGPYGGVVMTDEAIPGRLQAEVEGRRRVGTYDIASFKVRSRMHRIFEDGSTLTGPWVEADEDGTP